MMDFFLKYWIGIDALYLFLAEMSGIAREKILVLTLDEWWQLDSETNIDHIDCLCTYQYMRGDAEAYISLYRMPFDEKTIAQQIMDYSMRNKIPCYVERLDGSYAGYYLTGVGEKPLAVEEYDEEADDITIYRFLSSEIQTDEPPQEIRREPYL